MLLAVGLILTCDCGVRLGNHSIWMFVLSILTVIVAIGSMSFVNLLGVDGFAAAAITTALFFAIGSLLIPLEVK